VFEQKNPSRQMVFVDVDRGLVELEFRDDEIASFIGDHHHAIRRSLKGDTKALDDFEDRKVSIGGTTYRPETDVEVLVGLYWAGELDYQDPYDVGFLDEGQEEAGDGGE